MIESVNRAFADAVDLITKMSDWRLVDKIDEVAQVITFCFLNNGTLLVAGNGGSASQAEHIAGEFVGKFYIDRPALPAIAITCPTAALTAVANDYGYDNVFERQVEAFGKSGDVLLVLTTSGISKNVIKACDKANLMGITTIALTGEKNTVLHDKCTYSISVPSSDTPRVQEAHIMIGHIIAQIVEDTIFG